MEHIKEFWNSNAEKYKESNWASWGDILAIQLETECIGKYIKNGDYVLDAGCANGFSALEQLKTHDNINIVGIDYAENMIKVAKEHETSNLKFQLGDIKSIDYPDNTFDVVYTTRVLINLPTWKDQLTGIRECLRVVKPNGLVILSEGFWEPLVKLNALRQICNLPPLVEHDFNRYLKRNRLEEYLKSNNMQYKVEDFSSMYYLGSRLLRELMTDYQNWPGYSNPINSEFCNLSKKFNGGEFGIQMAYVITK